MNGQLVSLPHTLSSGLSLSSGVNQDKSEVIILRRDTGMDSELEIEIGVTMMTVKVPLSYSDKLCGLCGNLNDLHSHSSVQSWALSDFPVWYVSLYTTSNYSTCLMNKSLMNYIFFFHSGFPG